MLRRVQSLHTLLSTVQMCHIPSLHIYVCSDISIQLCTTHSAKQMNPDIINALVCMNPTHSKVSSSIHSSKQLLGLSSVFPFSYATCVFCGHCRYPQMSKITINID
eukprot:1105002_1